MEYLIVSFIAEVVIDLFEKINIQYHHQRESNQEILSALRFNDHIFRPLDPFN
jgi:hypothetical protein